MVALAPALDVHIVSGEEGVDAAVGAGLGIEGIARLLGLFDTQFASLDSLHPFLRVVGRIENLLALVVDIIRIPRVAVHQRAGSEEEHTRAHGERHDAVYASILRRIVVDGGQCHGRFEHLLVAIVDHIIEFRLSHHEVGEFEVGGSDIIRFEGYSAIVFGHLPPGIGAEELHLILHIVDFRLRQVMVGHGLDHIVEDITMPDVARHHVPEVTAPCGVDGPLSEDFGYYATPVPLLPSGRWCDIIGENLVSVGCECPLVGGVYDVVDIAEPGIHLVSVLEHHFGGKLRIRFLVEIVGARLCERHSHHRHHQACIKLYLFHCFEHSVLQLLHQSLKVCSINSV